MIVRKALQIILQLQRRVHHVECVVCHRTFDSVDDQKGKHNGGSYGEI